MSQQISVEHHGAGTGEAQDVLRDRSKGLTLS